MTIEEIKSNIYDVVKEYPIKSVMLFGSRAEQTNNEDSDIDLIVEFYEPISLLTLSSLRIELEEIFNLGVDIVHGPIREEDLIEVNKVVELYAA